MPFDSLPSVKRLDRIDESILEAARYLQEHGWIQGRARDRMGRTCLYGALEFIDLYSSTMALGRIGKYLGVINPVHWNDVKGRTKDEVIDALQGTVYHRIRKGRN